MKFITEEQVKLFRKEFEQAMKGISEKTGLDVNLGCINFHGSGFSAKITGEINDADVKKETFLLNAQMLGLDDITEADFQRVFTAHDGMKLQLVEINTRRPKNCMGYIEVNTGRGLKSGIEYYRGCIKKENSKAK